MTKHTRRLLARAAMVFLPLAVVATGLAGTVYVVAQQGLRTGADSLPLQMAEDAAGALDRGAGPATVAGASSLDASASLAPFIVVFDGQDRPVAETGLLDGKPPKPPNGVLDAAAAGSPNRVTWQPRAGLRFATVTVRWSGGTVMAARSLREVERLEDNVLRLVAAGWAGTLALLALVCVALAWVAGRRPSGPAADR